MTQVSTTTVKTVTLAGTTQATIRCVARQDMPEYGIRKDDVFYLTRSSKDNGEYYITRWQFEAANWTCSCPARKPCRHIKDAGIHAHARKLRLGSTNVFNAMAIASAQEVAEVPCKGETSKASTRKPASVPAITDKQRYQAPLNYRNKPFDLMRSA